MEAVPVAAPPSAAGAPAAGAAAGGGVDSVFEGSPPPQAARMTRAPALMRAREFRTIIGKAPLKLFGDPSSRKVSASLQAGPSLSTLGGRGRGRRRLLAAASELEGDDALVAQTDVEPAPGGQRNRLHLGRRLEDADAATG